MFFKKRPNHTSPMDQFLHRTQLNADERAVLDVYLTGLIQGLDAANRIFTANGKPAVYGTDQALSPQNLEALVDEFLQERADMKSQPLHVCAVMALMQRYPA
ncbi:hypothetical protein V5T82_14695 [Magnetovibrio sp. PR-2]|uniref:hypothetical protein n=1 Tax=Magnetovibrio sp. PR-2 TaxID=3120356 RepID=UPI002FCE5E27